MMTLETPDNETNGPVVTLTSAAIKQVQRLLSRPGNDGKFLRLGVRGGGCSGLSYVLDLETESDEMDLDWEVESLRVVVDRKSARILKGTTLDYSVKNLMEGGFVFDNPNAVRSCGCGTSFTIK